MGHEGQGYRRPPRGVRWGAGRRILFRCVDHWQLRAGRLRRSKRASRNVRGDARAGPGAARERDRRLRRVCTRPRAAPSDAREGLHAGHVRARRVHGAAHSDTRRAAEADCHAEPVRNNAQPYRRAASNYRHGVCGGRGFDRDAHRMLDARATSWSVQRGHAVGGLRCGQPRVGDAREQGEPGDGDVHHADGDPWLADHARAPRQTLKHAKSIFMLPKRRFLRCKSGAQGPQ